MGVHASTRSSARPAAHLRIARITGLALLLLVAFPAASPAYRLASRLGILRPDQFGPFRHWDLREFPDCTIPYGVQNNCRDIADVVPSVDAATDSWTAVSPSVIHFERRAGLVARDTLSRLDSLNVIFWDNFGTSKGLDKGTLAFTRTSSFQGSGVVLDADIVLNDRDYLWNKTRTFTKDALVQSGANENYNFDQDNDRAIDHNVLNVTIHGTDARVITFRATDFANLAAATRKEVASALQARGGGTVAGHRLVAYSLKKGNVALEDVPQGAIGTGTGEISIEVTGGTANDVLQFPTAKVLGGKEADIQSVVLHEMGHFFGLDHTDPNTVPVMFGNQVENGTKRVLTDDDKAGINFLYTPDLGDAPANRYPTRVSSNTDGRSLNRRPLKVPGQGAEHLFGTTGFQYEVLGAGVDGECVDAFTDLPSTMDPLDDGLAWVPPAFPGQALGVLVRITIAQDDSAQSHPCAGNRKVYLNGWFDWNDNGVWEEPAEHQIHFNTCASGVYPFFVGPTLGAQSAWCRLRLDYGEDAGAVVNVNDDLSNVSGAAQFGEVEDYFIDFRATPALAMTLEAVDPGEGARLTWSTQPDAVLSGSPRAFHVLRALGTGPRERVTTEPVAPFVVSRDVLQYEWADPDTPADGLVEYYVEAVEPGGAPGVVLGPTALVRRPLLREFLAPSPNPARGPVNLAFVSDRRRNATLEIFDLAGRRVAKLLAGPVERGVRSVAWDGHDTRGQRAATGVYWAKLRLDDWTDTRKVILAR